MVKRGQNGEPVLPPVPDAMSDSAGFLLNRAARIIRERVSAALQPLGLTPQQLGLLRIIDAHGPLSQQALSKGHKTDRTTVVHLLDELEKRELVIRTSNAQDRRSNLLFLTPRGRKVFLRAKKLAEREQSRFLAPLGGDEWEQMRQALIKLINHDTIERTADDD
ncbi:MAG TPA: MarR family transcriptional regulator [Candidatus Obscuribacterales bacterium]